MNGITKLAKIIKERDNVIYLGPQIAEVIEPMPNIKLKLLNGHMELSKEIEGDNLFISETLTNRLEVDVTFKDFESQDNKANNEVLNSNSFNSLSANGGSVVHPTPIPTKLGPQTLSPNITSASLQSGNITKITASNTKNDKEQKLKGKLKAQFLVTLKKGDLVLVIPNINEDQFFIIDKFKPIKEVKDKWEYYQK